MVAVRKSSLAFLCTVERYVARSSYVDGSSKASFVWSRNFAAFCGNQRVLRQVGMLILPHHQQHLPRDAQGVGLVTFPAWRLALRA